MVKNKKIVILGGGPAGIGAAWKLKELSHSDWQLYEKENFLGGLSASFRDSKGFTWDIGGHIYFSKSDYFNKVFNSVMRGQYYQRARNQFIFISNKFIPYPFQNHIRYLEPAQILECLKGLIKIQNNKRKSKNFLEFCLLTMGEGIVKYFMKPYNEKIWTLPLDRLSCHWIGERVSIINLEKILENIIFRKDETNWGPNYYFKYPKNGGCGDFWRRFQELFPQRLNFNQEFRRLDVKNKKIYFKNDKAIDYNILISTLPLDFLAKNSNLKEGIKNKAKNLKYNSGFITGLGIKGKPPKKLKDKVALYFPEKKYLFQRMIIQRYFSSYLTPPGFWALAFETSYSKKQRIRKEEILKSALDFLLENKFIKNRKEIINVWQKEIQYFYPLPTLDRDKNLISIQKELKKRDIYSVGRFGAWKYEIGNMDHSFMQGVEVVDKILAR